MSFVSRRALLLVLLRHLVLVSQELPPLELLIMLLNELLSSLLTLPMSNRTVILQGIWRRWQGRVTCRRRQRWLI